MQVRLLGHIEVIAGGGVDGIAAIGGPTQRRVLAALALGRGDVVPITRLVDVVWPDIACVFAGRNLTADEWNEFGPRTIDYRATFPQFATGI